MTLHWKAVEQYFTVVPFVFQFHPECNLRKFINFGLGTVRSERVIKGSALLLCFRDTLFKYGLNFFRSLKRTRKREKFIIIIGVNLQESSLYDKDEVKGRKLNRGIVWLK